MQPAEAFDYLGRLRYFGMKLGLDQMRAIASELGNPERRLRFLHVAGTNGKGSTCAFLESILRAAGYRVGLFTSPHLVSLPERIQVDRVPIRAEEIAEILDSRLRVFLNRLEADAGGRGGATFFEVVTALALAWFDRRQVDFVVWETGLGGRLDATNIVQPLVSVITSIARDHAMYLGDTLPEIAREKAGIIKEGVPLVTALQSPEVLAVLESGAAVRHVPVRHVGPDLPFANEGVSEGRQFASIDGVRYELGLIGAHQVGNAACAVATVRELVRQGVAVDPSAIAEGLRAAQWSGRFQRLRTEPPLVLDGAHNPAAIDCLMDTWRAVYGNVPFHLVCGFLADKEFPEMIERLRPLAGSVTVAGVASERSARPEQIAPLFGAVPVKSFPDLAAAWSHLMLPAPGPTLVCGSLFFVGEFLARWENRMAEYALNEKLDPSPQPFPLSSAP